MSETINHSRRRILGASLMTLAAAPILKAEAAPSSFGPLKQIDIHLQLGPRTFDFMRSDEVLDLVRPIVGDEITLSPIHHVRAKVPSKEGAGSTSHVVPWHQDAAVAFDHGVRLLPGIL